VTGPSLLGEVRDFLASLKTDWPDLFSPPKPPKVAQASPPDAPGLIPSVTADAPIKDAVHEGDLVALFRSRTELWAPRLGVTFGRVSVKDQRTLWGSCTREGNLNFSWRLALAPDPVLDYLIVHELAHRAEMNHSRRFWEVVERVCPGHRSHRRWLRKNAPTLHRAKRAS
jgi:hypothetical protein